MKKAFLLSAAVAWALPMASPTWVAAPAQASNANMEFCKDYISDPTIADDNLNLGECVSFLNTADHGGGRSFAVHWCDYLAENYPADFDLLYDSKKECVADNI